MDFKLQRSLQVLRRTPKTLKALLSGLSSDWTSANEGPETWSPFDVMGHLIHGEKTDWIPRARIILSKKQDRRFEEFDRTAQFEDSLGRTMKELLDEFEKLRHKNLETIKGFNLSEEDLNKTGIHPEFGEVTLQQLLATWTAHDLAHIYQISRVMARQYTDAVGPWKELMKVLRTEK